MTMRRSTLLAVVPLAAAALTGTVAAGGPASATPVTDAPVSDAPVSGAATTTAAAAPVALLVQYPDRTIRTWCVPYRSGITGADVLAVANPTYGTGPYAGFVLKISGKGVVPPTSSRYWAYWRSTTGRPTDYAYSAQGVTSTRPPARSVEAWVWTTGTSTTFPKRGYGAICPAATAA